MNTGQRPLSRFHVPGHLKRALIGSQGYITAVPLVAPPRSAHIPLLDDFFNDITSLAPNEQGGAVALESNVGVPAASFDYSHAIYPDWSS